LITNYNVVNNTAERENINEICKHLEYECFQLCTTTSVYKSLVVQKAKEIEQKTKMGERFEIPCATDSKQLNSTVTDSEQQQCR